ncbi:UDP-N-acetyl-D-glucosamine 2-epimerase, UDP-hydrolysing [Nitrosopumilaceae archaeon]|nr:UDP-N-acetylglucosamine 2-epimerase [Nitrosopumilus sp.]MDA7997088.1 UDP-N-acetylglucosamine 2-epimerase [Nitrosopumilus sp.]CAI9832039.1 UDP-N-acetyl-D-glucosamine 2-epimerase, UDP-hydrolysing [Nitrosopumilaceae archaeon]
MKKIFIVSERRADYAKLKPIMDGIKRSRHLDYMLLVTGSHLLKKYGITIKEIQRDGYRIAARFDMYPRRRADTGADMSYSIGKAIMRITRLITRSKPDMILSGFDTGADLAAAIAGAHMNIPVAHLEAGDVTGTIDEPIRHSISKFAHIHFATNRMAAERLVKMGEARKRIFTVGNPSLDAIRQVRRIPPKDLGAEFGLDMSKPYLMLLQHSVLSELDQTVVNIESTLEAVRELGVQTLVIRSNADAGSNRIIRAMKKAGMRQVESVRFEKYVNLLSGAAALVGNSSSGLMEAPFLRVPSVNIGTRQHRRPRAASVIDVGYDRAAIKRAIKKAMTDKRFLAKARRQRGLYGDGNSAGRIIRILERIDLAKIPIQKTLTY